MSDEELIARLRRSDEYEPLGHHGWAAADRIEALVRQCKGLAQAAMNNGQALILAEARAEQLEAALREIAAEASVPVRTKKKGGIKHKWMYRGWRKIAVERIDIARAALKGADHE